MSLKEPNIKELTTTGPYQRIICPVLYRIAKTNNMTRNVMATSDFADRLMVSPNMIRRAIWGSV